MAKYNIGGYIFNDENSAKKAAKELKAVEYILGQIKSADEKAVLQVYKKLLNQRLFSTEIGMGFLNQLRANLVASGSFPESDIPPVYTLEESIPLPPEEKVEQAPEVPVVVEEMQPKKEAKSSKQKKEKADKKNVVTSEDAGKLIKRLRMFNSFLIVCVLTLILCIVGMFYVSTTINSPNILNYRESITDEYASWKQQLELKEKELNEREAQLNERESNVSGIKNNN